MNQIILDGIVQKNPNLLSDISSFNISAITGTYKLANNITKNRFTYIRIIYPKPVDDYLINLIQPKSLVRIYGKLDSEQYEIDSGKIVYNKIICADRIVKIKFNKDTQQYEEVI